MLITKIRNHHSTFQTLPISLALNVIYDYVYVYVDLTPWDGG